ncbi:MAG TPA: molybdenum cofactor guanylyltransferase [Thermodesulfobacteriaceae bacterium]|nr:molybdenum cofactor guanylyltransferase [Thermodesulfobacteriaceae bacterium]
MSSEIPLEIRTAAVLAGGRSSRFGTNKALAPWFNGCVIDAVVAAAKKSADDVIIISCNHELYRYLNLPVYPDTVPDIGPLAGLHSALSHSKGSRVLLLACDMPLVTPGMLNWLWEISPESPVTAPELHTGIEPLHAIYHKSILPLVEHQMSAGELSLKSLIAKTPNHIVTREVIVNTGFDPDCLCNANTPDQLERLRYISTGLHN